MIAMPIAGQLSDRTGPGKIVPFGLLAIIGVGALAHPDRRRHVLLAAA